MRKENFKLSIIISLIVVLTLSTTYAFLQVESTNNNTTGTAGCFMVNYTGQAINNSSLQSTTNYSESASSEIVLYRNENCEIYTEAEILIHTYSEETTPLIDTVQALKYRIEITSGNGKILISTTDPDTNEEVTEEVTEITGVITNNKDANNNDIGLPLAKVKLTDTATTYKVYLWIDSEISRGAYHGASYNGYLYAVSTQTSTVTGS